MYLVLDAVAGPCTGRTIHCVANGETTIGRTEDAVIAMPDDFYMSRSHFGIRFDQDESVWRLRDLGSRHGTILNGERVTDVPLNPGDEFTAGKTEFRVESVEDGDIEASILAGAAAVMFTAVAPSDRAPAAKPGYKRQECASGLVSLVGEAPEPLPSSIAWLLARENPLYLLVDFARTSRPLPQQLDSVDFLFNWFDDDVLPFCSPVLLGPADPVDPYEIIDTFWRDDSVTCLFSDLEKPELMLRLRAAIRRDDGISTTVPRGMFGYCWPEAVRSVLESAPEKLTQPLMNCARFVLLESEAPDHWQIFCSKGDEKRLVSNLAS